LRIIPGVPDSADLKSVLLFVGNELELAMEREAFQMEIATDALVDPGGGTTAENFVLQFVPTAEGYYSFTENRYIYQYKDHLGNARVSFARNSAGAIEVTDKNDYYPFGMNHLDANGGAFYGQGSYKNYKFQGQELQETGFYSFKWRQYMPDVGRFFNIDPLAEKYTYNSTYAFSENRVIDGRELEGLEWSGVHYKNLDGSQKIQYSVNFKVLNNSTSMSATDVKARTTEITQKVESVFSGVDAEGVSVSTKVNDVQFVDKIESGDYYVDFVDKIEGASSPFTLGKVDNIGDSQSNRIQVSSVLKSSTGETTAHEFGHTTGLRHDTDNQNPSTIKQSMGFGNLMGSDGTGTVLTKQQFSEMKNNVPITTKVEVQKNQYITPFSQE
jgi:RHS repeat-associated protein